MLTFARLRQQFYCWTIVFDVFDIGYHYAIETDLEFVILLSLPPKCKNYGAITDTPEYPAGLF